MSDLHPDKFGQSVEADVTRYGRNNNDGTYPEDMYIKCKKCGFIMNKARHSKGWGEGNAQPNTLLNGAVLVDATTITVDSTTGFPSSGYIYIYDVGSYATPGDVSSTYTDATNAPMCDRVAYTGTSATTFTGCTGARAHDDNMVVRGERTPTGGCPYCGTFNYD
jgi:hypothetical protein